MRKIMNLVALAIFISLSISTNTTSAQADNDCFAEPEIMTTADGVEFVRTPDACFENLPDWDYEPQFVEINGMRQAYVDVGSGESGETILLLHGQPSWSYLYRHMIPVLAEEGHRVIAMDHLGFGRSDKPIDWEYYTYVDHVERLEVFIQELELEGITTFVQDWGSLIGLQVVGTNPEWFDRLVVGNGFLPTYPEGITLFELPDNPIIMRNLFHTAITSIPAQQEPLVREPLELNEVTDIATEDNYFGLWIDYARNDERFRADVFIEAWTYYDLSPEEEAGYASPFPSREYMGGARAFPGLANELGGVTDSGWSGLGEFDKPFLTIWGNNDQGNLGQPAVQQELIDHIPGSVGWDHVRLEEAGHFLQDDHGEEIARRMNAFIAASPVNELDADAGASPSSLSETAIPAVEQTQFMPAPDDLLDFRYCEILAAVPGDDGIRVSAFNTMGLSQCPSEQWSTVDADAISDAYGLLGVVPNGPRYWVVNDIVSPSGLSSSGQVSEFNGMEMRLVAQINVTPVQVASMGFVPYSEQEVVRDTVYTYDAGSRVYELISPDGDIYRMQSYSQQIDPKLTLDDLETPGDRLDLPEGWSFQTRILEEDSFLSADGIAYLVSDELNNAYQLVTTEAVAESTFTPSSNDSELAATNSMQASRSYDKSASCNEFYADMDNPPSLALAWCESGTYFTWPSTLPQNSTFDALNIFHVCLGNPDNPGMLLIHGYPTSSFDYASLAEILSEEYYVCALDTPGYGFSDKPQDGYDYSLFDDAQLVDYYVQEIIGFDEFALFTHDKGASVGLAFLQIYQAYDEPPYTITHHFLTNGNLYLPLAQLSEGQQLLLDPTTGPLVAGVIDSQGLAAGVVESTFSSDVSQDEIDAYASIFEYQEGYLVQHEIIQYLDERREHELEWLATLNNSEIPATIIWGELDAISPYAVSDYVWENYLLNRAVPSTYWRIPCADHYLQVEYPDLIATIIQTEIDSAQIAEIDGISCPAIMRDFVGIE